jgi:Mor family transcriptional regulator
MMRDKFDFSALEPDIVALVLQKVIAMSPGFSEALARQIEQEVKEEHGGQRLFVPKGAKRLTPEQRAAVFQDGLTDMDNDAISKKHKVSRATIYRVMKSGGGRFSG